jgi:uncharacterized protein involved in outer membrane biogenesis
MAGERTPDPRPPARWSRPLRSHPIATGSALTLLAIVVAFGLCEWRGWPFLRSPLQDTLSQHLDRDVRVGSAFNLHLLGRLRLRSDALVVGPPRWADAGSPDKFFEAHDVYLELPWRTLWNVVVAKKPGPLHVAALDVGSFDATLWRRKDGRANWEFKLPKSGSNEPAAIPQFDRLQVRNGVMTLDDAPTTLKLHAFAETREGLAANGETGLHVHGDGHYREGDFDFTLRSNGVLPLIAPEGVSTITVPITLQGRTPHARLKFEGQARDIVHLQALQGSFALSGSSLAQVAEPFGITLPTTAAFESDGKLAKNGDVWQADIARFEVGSSRLAGDFSFDRRPALPLLTGVLRGRNLDLKDLGPAFGAPAPGAANPPKPPGRLFPDREFDIPSLKRMNADVRVELQRADLHTAMLEPMVPLHAHIELRDGMLKIEQLLARTSGGEIQGKLGLDGREVKHPRWTGDLHVSGVELERWLHIADTHAKPQATAAMGKPPARRYITGRLGGHFQFDGRGRSIAAMLGSLDGTLAAWVNDGTVSHLALEAAGLDIAQGLGVLVRGDDALPMQCAVTQFSARDGVLHTDVAMLDSPDTTMLVNGDISLRDERFALVAQADPKDFSPATLRAPIHLEGTFKQPHVRLETKPIATKAVAAVALGTVVTPLAALIPLIDPGKKAPIGCQQALERMRRAHGVEPPKIQTAGTERALQAQPPASAPRSSAKPGAQPGPVRH